MEKKDLVLLVKRRHPTFTASESPDVIGKSPRKQLFINKNHTAPMSCSPPPPDSSEKKICSIPKNVFDPNCMDPHETNWEWKVCHDSFKDQLSKYIGWKISQTSLSSELSKMKVQITTDRHFMHSDQLGWNWHKSWNLPPVTFSIFANDFDKKAHLPDKLQIRVSTCKLYSHEDNSLKVVKISVNGDNVRPLKNGSACFKALKFATTSHNNDGMKLRLLISILYNNSESGQLELVESYISPPIFVDSRKSSRESHRSKKIRQVSKYFEPFHPKLLRKYYAKKQLISASKSVETPINGDITGLCDYLTASNIKNKVKHPLFLLLRFPKCVKLYYNTTKFQSWVGYKSLESCILCRLQTIFYRIQSQCSETGLHSVQNGIVTVPLEDKDFILVFQDSNEINPLYFTKSVSEYIEPLKDDALHVTLKSSAIPDHFRASTELQIERTYRALLPYLLKLKTKLSKKEESKTLSESDGISESNHSDHKDIMVKTSESQAGSPERMPQFDIMEEEDDVPTIKEIPTPPCNPSPKSKKSSKPRIHETDSIATSASFGSKSNKQNTGDHSNTRVPRTGQTRADSVKEPVSTEDPNKSRVSELEKNGFKCSPLKIITSSSYNGSPYAYSRFALKASRRANSAKIILKSTTIVWTRWVTCNGRK
jgi:hypothetical protein